MSRVPLFGITFFFLIATSAVAQRVDCEFSNEADFSKFKTYKWVTFKNAAAIDELTAEQIKASFNAALARKGLTKVDTDTADLFIGYQSSELITEERPVVPTWDESPPTITQGELAIDMYTPANHHLVFRGVATKSLDPKASAKKRQKNLNKAVAKLVNNYPPGDKSSCRGI